MSDVTVVATVEPDAVPPRVRLDVTDVGSPELFGTTVTRLDPDGRVVPVRTLDGDSLVLSTSGVTRVGTLYDYEAPYGLPVTYSTEESPENVSVEVTVDEARIWLIHPGVPALSMPVTVQTFGNRSKRVRQGIFRPMGRSNPVVVTDGSRQGAEYDLTLLTLTDQERASLEALVSDAGVLLLNVPVGRAVGFGAEYVAIGDMAENRVTRFALEPMRAWELPCVVVDRPAGGTTADRTYTDLLNFATYAELQAAYSTYLDLLAGP